MAVLAGIYSIDPDAILPDFDQIQHGLHGLFGSGDEKVVSTSHLSCILHQPDKQMALHETEDSCLFLEGELFDQNGAMPQNRSVRRIEQSLEKSRFSSLGKLNGMFCFIYWNKATRTLILGRDHFGSYPLFYIRQDNRLKFSSMLQPLLDLPSVKTQPDYAGISHLLNFGHWLGDHTFAEEIKSIPPGSVMVCRDGQIEMVEYWKPEFSGVPVQNPEQFFDELYDIWNQAVKRRIDEKTGFLLSGGIDSRMVASVLPEDQPIWTLTYGMPDAWDMVFARRIAKHIPVSLNMLLLDESVMPDFRSDLENHFLYSEGFPGLIGTYLSATSRHAANHVSILLEGTGGEITRRSVYRRFAHFNKNNMDFRTAFIQSNNQLERYENYLTGDFYSTITGGWTSSAHAVFLDQNTDASIHDFLDLYYLKHRVRNIYSMGNNFEKQFIRCRLPFFDTEFIRAILMTPDEIRKTGEIPVQLIGRGNPSLLNIPLSRGDLPLSVSAGVLKTGWAQTRERLLQKAANRLHLFGKYRRKKSMTDYPAWLRGCWKEGLLSLMNDPATFHTDWFNKKEIEAFVSAFLEGQNSDISILNNLLTLNWISKKFRE